MITEHIREYYYKNKNKMSGYAPLSGLSESDIKLIREEASLGNVRLIKGKNGIQTSVGHYSFPPIEFKIIE